MSTYTATLLLGPVGVAPTHTYVVDSTDPAPSEADPVLVLDDLAATWSFPEDQLWPSQPNGQTFTLRLLVDDLSTLSDLGVGDVAYIKVESGGAIVWEFMGLIGAMLATVVRRKAGRKVLVTLTIVDPLGQLADVLVNVTRPAEQMTVRCTAIVAAITAALDADPLLAPAIDRVLDFGSVNPIYLPAIDAQQARAYDLLVDILRQRAGDNSGRGASALAAFYEADPATQLGPFAVFTLPLVYDGLEVPEVPGQLALTAHKLGVTFPLDGHGIAMPAGEIEEGSLAFSALRFDDVSRVTVNSPDAGSVTLSNGLPGREVVLEGSTLRDPAVIGTDDSYAFALAKAYLPRPTDVRWTADGFLWRPSDAELADLPYPLNPSNWHNSALSDWGDPHIIMSPVAIANLPAVVNPGSDSDFYGGTFSTLVLRIRREAGYGGVLSIEGKIARRIETHTALLDNQFVSWAQIKATYPTVKTKVGVDVLDPTMSTYELLLARKIV